MSGGVFKGIMYLRFLLCVYSLLTVVKADDNPSIDHKIYRLLNGVSPCFRLTNATSQIGCSASSTQTRGVVHVISSLDDLASLRGGENGPYIVAMESIMFTPSVIRNLTSKEFGRVHGIIVRHDTLNLTGQAPVEGFSPETKCPNSLFGLGPSDTCDSDPWNPLGNSLNYMDFKDFPIFAVANDTFNSIYECYKEHNRPDSHGDQSYPLCSLEMAADMYVVKDTETCIRRSNLLSYQLSNKGKICQPLGDRNLWTMPQGLADVKEGGNNKKIILVATKLDSTAFFEAFSFGANNDAAAIALQLSVMETIGNLLRQRLVSNVTDYSDISPIMFVFFQGESWGYIGSSRMVYDLTHELFPLKNGQQLTLDMIDTIVELSHVGIQEPDNDKTTFYVHGNFNTTNSKASAILSTMQSFDDSIDLVLASRFPPASAQSFVKERNDISVVVIGDYDQHYNNKFFGSRFDDLFNLDFDGESDNSMLISPDSPLVQELSNLSLVLTKTLLKLSNQSVDDSNLFDAANGSSATIAQLLECLLYNSNCSLLRAVSSRTEASNLQPVPIDRYVTVSAIVNTITVYVQRLMTYFMADRWSSTVSDCPYTWFRGEDFDDSCSGGECVGVCLNTSQLQVEQHLAESPAFVLGDYRSTRYSTWAESTWSSVSLRIYLVTSIEHQLGILVGGMVVQLVSIYLAIQFRRGASKLFTVATESHDPTTPPLPQPPASELHDFDDSEAL